MFKNKNFTLVFLGALVSNIGALLYSFAVSFYILSLSGNNSIIQGVYLAITGLTNLVFSFLGGVIADRYHKGKIMYLCDYIKGLLILFSTLCIFIFKDNNIFKIVILFIVGFVGSVVSSFFNPASSALLPIIVNENDYQKANSYFSILSSFQTIAGVLLAGILYSLISIYTLFIIVGVCYALSGVSEMFIKYNHKPNSSELTIKSTCIDIKDGFVYFLKDKALIALSAITIFLNFFFNPIWGNGMPYIVETDFIGKDYLFKGLLTPELYSSIFSISLSIGSLIGGIIISNKVFKNTVLVNKIAMFVCALFLTIFSVEYYVFVDVIDYLNGFLISSLIIFFAIGLTLVYINVPINVCIQKTVDKEMMGKVNSVLNIGSQGLIPLASVLAGIVIKSFGTSILFFICSIGFLTLSFFFAFNKNVNELDKPNQNN